MHKEAFFGYAAKLAFKLEYYETYLVFFST